MSSPGPRNRRKPRRERRGGGSTGAVSLLDTTAASASSPSPPLLLAPPGDPPSAPASLPCEREGRGREIWSASATRLRSSRPSGPPLLLTSSSGACEMVLCSAAGLGPAPCCCWASPHGACSSRSTPSKPPVMAAARPARLTGVIGERNKGDRGGVGTLAARAPRKPLRALTLAAGCVAQHSHPAHTLASCSQGGKGKAHAAPSPPDRIAGLAWQARLHPHQQQQQQQQQQRCGCPTPPPHTRWWRWQPAPPPAPLRSGRRPGCPTRACAPQSACSRAKWWGRVSGCGQGCAHACLPAAAAAALRARRRRTTSHTESVAVAPDGTLWMLDRYGYAHTARRAAGGAYELLDSPVAYVGPGRPLGFHFDSSGDLIICDSLKARGWAGRAGGGGGGAGADEPRACVTRCVTALRRA